MPIPASQGLYYRCEGGKNTPRKVFIKFCVIETDAEAQAHLQTVSQARDLASMTGVIGTTMPHVRALSGAMNLLTTLGKTGLQEYAKPDHVFSKDVEFRVAAGKGEEKDLQQVDCFLRYGYYFFLSDKVDARLYVQAGCSSQNMGLILRRIRSEQEVKQGAGEFFPLTGVSYVVVKVTKGCMLQRPREWDKVRSEHRSRLECMLAMNGIMDVIAKGER